MAKSRFMLIFMVCVTAAFLIYSAFLLEKSLAAKNYAAKGLQALNSGDLVLAEKFFVRALLENPRFLPVYIGLGPVYEKKKEFISAIIAYEKIIKLSKNKKILLPAYDALARLYSDSSIPALVKGSDWQKRAVQYLQELVRFNPQSPAYHLRLGIAYFNAVNPGAGLAEFNLASGLAKDKSELWVHQKLKEIYLQMNMLDKAAQEENEGDRRP